jgi:hypothetical protein
MKLRIQGNSLRLRISQSELAALMQDAQLEATIALGIASGTTLTYSLKHRAGANNVALDYSASCITVTLSTAAATHWAQGNDVGIYGSVPTSAGPLELMIEKDFACLDGTDMENADTFPNPNAGSVC